MYRMFMRPIPLVTTLLLLGAIPILMSVARLVQIPTGTLPADAAKFTAVPFWHFVHALGGAAFGILGPVQFAGVLRRKYGRAHRITGRIFVAAGLLLSVSSLRILWQFPDASTWVLAVMRLIAGAALAAALILALRAAVARNIPRHRAWMIRAYAIGMGAATIALIMFPIFVITGAPIVGFASDLLFVASWAINIIIAEWVIRRI